MSLASWLASQRPGGGPGNVTFLTQKDPVTSMFDACGCVFGFFVGTGVGGIIGGIGGAVFGAGFTARTKGAETEEGSAVKDVRPANTLEPPTESPEADRLIDWIAELDESKPKDGPPKEE